jgi:hypothetical protein
MIWTPLNHSVFKKKGRLWFFLKEEEDYIMKKKITVLNKQLLTIMSNYKHEIFNDDLGWEIYYLRDLQQWPNLFIKLFTILLEDIF